MGAWSDRIGRKPIMLTGMVLAVLTYYPIYGLMASFATKTGQLFLFPYFGYSPVVLSVLVLIQPAAESGTGHSACPGAAAETSGPTAQTCYD